MAMKSTIYTPPGGRRAYKIGSEPWDDEGSVQFVWWIGQWPVAINGDQPPMITHLIGLPTKRGEYTTPSKVFAALSAEVDVDGLREHRAVWEEDCQHVANYVNKATLAEPWTHADHKAEYLPGRAKRDQELSVWARVKRMAGVGS